MRRTRMVAWMIALVVAAMPFRPSAAAPRCYPTDRFAVLADGMVRDALTALVWQQDGSGTRAGCSGSSNQTCKWAEAQAYCSGLGLGGYSDWRLPTVRELRSIVDYSVSSPAISQTAFPNTPSSMFWTSSTFHGVSAGSNGTWMVHFGYGKSDGYSVGSYLRVRCVR